MMAERHALRSLEGQVSLITGATAGIGEATARALARRGSALVLAARRQNLLEELAAELSSGNTGVDALAIRLDVTDQDQVEAAVKAAMDHFGQIDVLVNNAGIGKLDWLERMDPERDIERQIDVNLMGVVRMAKAVLPHMQARRRGHIINMCSMAGLLATPTYSIYAASKFGVRGFSDALRREVYSWGIHVSAIYPSGVRTDFAGEAVAKRRTGLTTPRVLVLTKEDVAEAIVKLVFRPKRMLVLPRIFRLAVWLGQVWPGLIDWLVVRFFVLREREEELALPE
ncbi:MAG: SDR family NAD(P)-dependent oxidoreductase [Anaerolineales bacterium]|jgi:short-subunit dehydrogenase